MPLRYCDAQACERPAERDKGTCFSCLSYLCEVHLCATSHRCAPQDLETCTLRCKSLADVDLLKLLRRINVRKLISIASSKHNGISCRVSALQPEIDLNKVLRQSGGQNCNFDIEFDDGICWTVRIRRDDASLPPSQTQAYITSSEAGTLKFLEMTNVPSPKILHVGLDPQSNGVNVPFLLMQKLPGHPLDWAATPAVQATKILKQLADIYIDLDKLRVNVTGSSVYPGGVNDIGGFAQVQLFQDADKPLGPFHSNYDSISAILEHQRQMILIGEQSTHAVDAYLAIKWRQAALPRVLAALKNDGTFALKHFDDKGDHLLVDENFKITGIIDWEFASFEDPAFAFASPCMLWPIAQFYDGVNNLSRMELEFAEILVQKGRGDLATYVREGRRLQRYFFFNGGGVATDLEEHRKLFQGLRDAWAFEDELSPHSYTDWREASIQRLSDDQDLAKLMAQEEIHDT